MRSVFYKAIPYHKEEVALALESGVDGLIVPDFMVESAQGLARCTVFAETDTPPYLSSAKRGHCTMASKHPN